MKTLGCAVAVVAIGALAGCSKGGNQSWPVEEQAPIEVADMTCYFERAWEFECANGRDAIASAEVERSWKWACNQSQTGQIAEDPR